MGFFKRKEAPVELLRQSSAASTSLLKMKQMLRPAAKPAALEVPRKTQHAQRRVSTIVEDSQFGDFDADDYEDECLDDVSSEDDDYDVHTHVVQKRDTSPSVSQLLQLMGFCGLGPLVSKEKLNALANEELRRTFSMLSETLKIHRLSPTMNRQNPELSRSVISEPQAKLINTLTADLHTLFAMKHDAARQRAFFKDHKTLYDRHGLVKDVIGRGAYGVIKIIDSGVPVSDEAFSTRSGLYAVKEIHKRPGTNEKTKETREKFIERVISEFIVLSTLNNKHIVRTVDFLVTVPPQDEAIRGKLLVDDTWKISQVMECTAGGDLFSYCKKCILNRQFLSIDEIDCIVKQISKGLWYMHKHGVAHCDLKLENVLLAYDKNNIVREGATERSRIICKISDFGKSNVFRTQWDTAEQLLPAGSGPIGSEPYMAPEEHTSTAPYSLVKKDCWSLGVLILILFNIRRSFFLGHGGICLVGYYDEKNEEEIKKSYSACYLWHSTEVKHGLLHKQLKYRDEVFDEFVKHTMLANYSDTTKEWSIERKGTFIPIETLFDTHHEDGPDRDEDFEEDDFAIRKYLMYKLLDLNASTRLTVDALLRSDWLVGVECCGE